MKSDPHGLSVPVRSAPSPEPSPSEPAVAPESAAAPAPREVPIYDGRPNRRTLLFRGLLVKQFRGPADAQETIVQAFEEEGWPECIDDPLPGGRTKDPKKRLHNAVARLKKGQVNELIVFAVCNRGKAVTWKPKPK